MNTFVCQPQIPADLVPKFVGPAKQKKILVREPTDAKKEVGHLHYVMMLVIW